MSSLQWRLSLIATAIAILAGCTIVGQGDPPTPFFCAAHDAGVWDIYAIVYGFLLLLALPAIVGLITIGGLMVQPTLLKSGALGCDLP